MTHTGEENVTMPGGTGFVMIDAHIGETGLIYVSAPEVPGLHIIERTVEEVMASFAALPPVFDAPREVWTGIESDVAELERLLR